jgi:CheY-like chemotaxis protein
MALVLVVDDDQPTREVLRMMLEDAGHAVSEAANGQDALAALRVPDRRMVALIDQLMPGLDGIGTLATAADDPDLATRHVYILMTADARPLTDSELSLLSSLGAPLVRKPFDIDLLLDTVSRSAARLAGA